MKESINWALVGTGGITNKFIVGLKAAEGCASAVVSRTLENAQRFAAKNNIEKVFDNYDRMLEDPDIDVVYIGTPHTTHKDLTIRALNAKKAVLCEKPCAVNAEEFNEMVKASRVNNVFLMEAMWTRFTPPLQKVREWLSEGHIGEVQIIEANFGFNAPFAPKGRLFNPDLGGGALLDAGIYPLSLISMVFGGKIPLEIKSYGYLGQTGVDEHNLTILSYGGPQIAYASSALRSNLTNDAWIYGTQGRIHIPNYIWARSAKLFIDNGNIIEFNPQDFISNGYNYEAFEVMKCIKEGKKESEIMTLDESMVLMETMDRIRAQW
jgi:predicted dehydrogenase